MLLASCMIVPAMASSCAAAFLRRLTNVPASSLSLARSAFLEVFFIFSISFFCFFIAESRSFLVFSSEFFLF